MGVGVALSDRACTAPLAMCVKWQALRPEGLPPVVEKRADLFIKQ